ncbi:MULTISPECIES: hypothetical protein [Streptomyces]|uniref:Uncharacterized protein n=1 Tax=Streptomyces bottropensis ATCC 25435 TaxID=1054862 RepID=M3FLQ2_9ACTN|nr:MULTISPECIES: hypothetical protein [Streptomyces]EMF53865.1 hypothetical protein SBD_5409 [Streptomyces bottropensis ATCC 25435]MZD17856.1 hypothetical protein [Streptomyces sp. SID5476]
MGRKVHIQGEKHWIWWLTAVAVACCVATSIVFTPGFMSPDSIDQLRQAMGRTPLTDWHPPVLSLLWRALIAVTGTPASMAVLQSVVLWGALWVLARCVWEMTASRAGSLAVLGLGLTPPVLTFVGVVWKDVHAACALLAACAVAFVGLRLRDSGLSARTRWALLWLGVFFLAYAVLVRKNAFLAAIPMFVLLVLALWHSPGRRTWAACTAALVAAVVLPAAAISMFARPVQTDQGAQILLDDLVHVLTVEELRSADVRPELRDRLVAAAEECDRVDAVSDAYWACYQRSPDGLSRDADQLTSLWLREMPGHASGYLQYRLRLFTALLFETGYVYQQGVFANDLGIEVARPRLEATLASYVVGAATDLRPLFRGWFWLAVALVLTIRPGRGRFSLPIRALGISSLAYVLGYLPIVPATNYRYVYWPALACALGLLLLWLDRAAPDRPTAGSGVRRDSAAVTLPTAVTAHRPTTPEDRSAT